MEVGKLEVIVLNDPEKFERRLRGIELQLERLFSIIDTFDDIKDVTVALNQYADQLNSIGQITNHLEDK